MNADRLVENLLDFAQWAGEKLPNLRALLVNAARTIEALDHENRELRRQVERLSR